MTDLPRRAIAALLWIAAFCFACGIFLSSTLLLRALPPTPHVAVGRVTIENVSKAREYATAVLFFVIVPALTIPLYRLGRRMDDALRARLASDDLRDLVSLLFVAPFFLAPFLYLTTFKWGWPLLIPLLLSQLLPRGVIAVQRTHWLRRLLSDDLAPYHALLITSAFAWILFRYIAIAKRIAHIPTLFLETVFVLFFLLVFWAAFVLIAKLASLLTGSDFETSYKRLAVATMPMLALPVLGLMFIPAWAAILVVLLALLIAIAVALRGADVEPPQRIRAIVAYVAIPLLLYCFAYASTASLTQWVDLFHRGESLGPASDYLRGKVPYRDVFVLHGLLYDGLLDASLMRVFGRDEAVALWRPVVLGSFASPALWYLGMALFDSIPLAILTMFLGIVTTVDNERALFEIATLALLLAGTRTRIRPLVIVLSGLVAGVALFFSFDIGLYSFLGALLYFAGRALLDRRTKLVGPLSFLGGFALGALPFVIYLGARGVIGDFVQTSFVTIPRIIDAVWSLPFPDLTKTFRKDLNLHTISDFLLFEHFRYVLNPLVICIALLCLVQRAIRGKSEWIDAGLLALTTFAILTQRSALGRADFPHQYFSAFLIGPMILALIVLIARAARPLWSANERSARAFLLLAGLAVLPMLVTALWVPDIINTRLDDTLRYLPRVKGYIRDPLAEEVKYRVGSVGFHVDEMSSKGSPIFDFSNQPALYFYTERPNPTRFYQVPILSPAEFQRETIEALERSKAPIVIRRSPQAFDVFDEVDNSVRAQAVAAYLDDYYSYARSTRGVEIWKRKRGLAKPDLSVYLRQIRVPDVEDLSVIGARSRLVFPGVGSTPGANESFWRTDLILHNPFKERMNLRLRYVAGDTRIDRRLTLGGGRSIRWEDVVKTFFGAPDSLGVIWIEYQGDRGPVARVKTYDVARQATGSLESPLSRRDSATAGSDRPDLTIVGLPGGGPSARRINVGVVNIGEIPATYRVSVHNQQGQQIGRAYEEGIPEDESVLVGDLDSRLGVKIDENVTVRIRMIAGTCIGYASAVDVSGDNHFIAAVPSPRL